MVHYKFKPPNLVELLLFISVALIISLGFWLLARAFGTIPEFMHLTIEGVTAIFIWLSLILLGIIAIELESMREHIKNIEEKISKR